MGRLTLTGSATTTIDGETFSLRSQFVVDASHVAEWTRNIGTTYVELFDDAFVFIAIENLGAEDAVLRLFDGTDYIRFSVPAGGHILIPGAGIVDVTSAEFKSPSIRTIANTSRIKVIIGTA